MSPYEDTFAWTGPNPSIATVADKGAHYYNIRRSIALPVPLAKSR